MTEQADLKARVEERDPVLEIRRIYTVENGWPIDHPLSLLAHQAADRITDLEAERDELAEQVSDLERDAEIVSSEFEKDCWRAVRSLLIKVGHDDFSEGVTADLACEIISDAISDAEARAQAAESRLALAEKVVEAGRRWVLARQVALTLTDKMPSDEFEQAWHELGESEWAMSAALTAYAENTSSKDLTTGEDDA